MGHAHCPVLRWGEGARETASLRALRPRGRPAADGRRLHPRQGPEAHHVASQQGSHGQTHGPTDSSGCDTVTTFSDCRAEAPDPGSLDQLYEDPVIFC